MQIEKIKQYLLLYGAFIIYSGVSIFAKYASKQDTLYKMCVFIALEIICLGVYAIVWQQVLKHFSLVTAMASKGIVVIFNLIWSILLFDEVITVNNIVGAAIIIFGIWVVSSDV